MTKQKSRVGFFAVFAPDLGQRISYICGSSDLRTFFWRLEMCKELVVGNVNFFSSQNDISRRENRVEKNAWIFLDFLKCGCVS